MHGTQRTTNQRWTELTLSLFWNQTHEQQHALLGMLVLDRNNSYDVVAVEHVVIVLALRQCAIVRQSTSSEIPILCMALQ